MGKVSMVSLRKANRATGTVDWATISREEFLGYPIESCIEHILNGDAKFYDEDGSLIPVTDAISLLDLA